MKKIMIVIALLWISSGAIAQEKIGKLMHIDCTRSNNEYSFTYKDYKYQHINEIKSFVLSEEDFQMFTSIVLEGYSNTEETYIDIETENDFFKLKFTKSFGVIGLYIYHSVNKSEVIGMSRYISKKQAIKLFGFKK